MMMKALSGIFLLLCLYYLFWHFHTGDVGSVFAVVNLLIAGALVYFFSPDWQAKKLWFAAKRYGWGWTPVTWQGWVVTVGATVLIIYASLSIDRESHSASDTLLVAVPLIALILAALMVICYKTGEKPSWRWGKKKEN